LIGTTDELLKKPAVGAADAVKAASATGDCRVTKNADVVLAASLRAAVGSARARRRASGQRDHDPQREQAHGPHYSARDAGWQLQERNAASPLEVV
jgi:hypothetical protein